MSIALLVASDNASSATQVSGSSSTLVIIASGTWGGGTLTLEYSHDGTTFVTSAQTLTANGAISFQDRPGLHWRVTLAGATAGSITATAF